MKINLNLQISRDLKHTSAQDGKEITITQVLMNPTYSDSSCAIEEFVALSSEEQQAMIFTELEKMEEFELLAELCDSERGDPAEFAKHFEG